MSDQEVLLQKGKWLEAFVTAKTKVQMLRDEANREAKVLEGFVEFLRSGGDRGRIEVGMPPEAYFSEKVARLISDLRESLQEKSALKERLSGIGVTVD